MLKATKIYNQEIKAEIKNLGSWLVVAIVQEALVQYEHCPAVHSNMIRQPEKESTTILTFGKYFSTEAEAETFMKTKLFKAIFTKVKKYTSEVTI